MPNYPSMDQYNDVVQHPRTAFSDAALKSAKILTNGMGLPVALGGGFALTYTAAAANGKFAVRCFHKEARGLEARYAHIDKGLRSAGGPYFVGFEFQPAGVLVNGQRFPIVKMDWVEGDTLGSFLEDNYRDKTQIERLRTQFIELERFLRAKGIAHGDLQNGNVLVKSDLKLIDYDGMYVPSLPLGQGAELGHKHFQHPKRSAADFGPNIDRFSFIVVELSLRALAADPRLFSKYSNGENILLTANDFLDPANSTAFADIKGLPALARDAAQLASICAAPFGSVPTLEDFLGGKNIPAAPIIIRTEGEAKAAKAAASYVGAYEVVDGQNFAAIKRQVGNKVELVGVITKIHLAKTKYGKLYCFAFFDNSRQCVKLNIWSEGLAKLPELPSQSWVGTWLSVQGLVDPPYTSPRHGTSLSITITANTQIRKITKAEAERRLRKGTAGAAPKPVDNQSILVRIGSTPAPGPAPARKARTAVMSAPRSAPPAARTRNQAILERVNQGQPSTAAPVFKRTVPPASSATNDFPWGWIALAVVVLLLFFGR